MPKSGFGGHIYILAIGGWRSVQHAAPCQLPEPSGGFARGNVR